MQIVPPQSPEVLTIRPTTAFAFLRVLPLIFLSLAFLGLAYRFFPALAWLSIAVIAFASYHFLYIRRISYTITQEIIRWQQGIFFIRTDTVEMYRVKDYIITRPFIFQLFRLMNLTLKTTDPENLIIWLRGIPFSDLTDIIRAHVQETRQHNRIYEIN